MLPLVTAGSGRAATTAAAASTVLCSGYRPCKDAGMPHQGYAQANGTMYWQMFSGTNCTNYVAYRMIKAGMPSARPAQLRPGMGNAEYWGTSFPGLTDQTPAIGAVAWWRENAGGAGSAGHVAYVERVEADAIVISESNWGSPFTWRRIAKGGRHWPSGFIHLRDAAVGVVSAPVVSGVARVGQQLKASVGAWRPAAATKVQWFANGVALTPNGAPATLTVPPAALGKKITVTVTATATSYLPGKATAVAAAPVQPGVQTQTAKPAIVGTPQVDKPLAISAGSYAPAPERIAVQWAADGQPIPGATATTFTPTLAQAGKRISAVVSSVRTGYTTLTTGTAATAPVLAPDVKVVRPGGISGSPLVGQTLTASAGVTDPATATPAYQWLRNGRPIPGATSARYVVTPADLKATLSARVGLSNAGYRPITVALAPLTAVRSPSSLRVTSSNRTPRSALVKVVVTTPGVRRPAGKVWVNIAGHKVAARIVNGYVKVRIRNLKPGKRLIKVYYAGSPTTTKVRAEAVIQIKSTARRSSKRR